MIYSMRLKELRESELLKLREVGELIGVDRKVYHHFESEYTIIPLKHLNTICNYFNVSIDYIFGFTDVRQYLNSKRDIDKEVVGKRLKCWRKANKLTLKTIAERIGTFGPTLTRYEQGKYLISTAFLYDICYNYNVSADYLLGKIDTERELKLNSRPKFK